MHAVRHAAAGRPRRLMVPAAALAGLLVLLPPAGTKSAAGQSPYAAVDDYVRTQMTASRIPGVALAIVQRGRITHARGFGYDGRGHAITPQAPFWIGSNTKSFTALAVMQLVDAGLVELDAPVQRYLPDFATADAAASARITVRHLLNQTSGFSRRDGIALAVEARQQTLEQAVASFRALQPNRPVGESFEYSNVNFVVLGLLIERLSGQRWPDYVRDSILKPLGMVNSYATLGAAMAGGLTRTHVYWFGRPVAAEASYLESLAPTGYLYSSAEDLARYLLMYLQDGVLDGRRIVSEARVAEMFVPGPTASTFALQGRRFHARYGAGWFIGPFGAAADARWHAGTLPHFIAWLVLLPDTEQAVVVLINASHQLTIAGAGDVFARIPLGVVDLLRGEEPPAGPGLNRFYLVANGLIVAVLSLQAWALYRLARRRRLAADHGLRRAAAFAPLLWELGAGLVLLAGLAAYGATFALAAPDLTLAAGLLALLWLVTGVTRCFRLLRPRPQA